MDVGDLALNIGDQATNINSGKSCGPGPVICTGTGAAPNWKNLATGAPTSFWSALTSAYAR